MVAVETGWRRWQRSIFHRVLQIRARARHATRLAHPRSNFIEIQDGIAGGRRSQAEIVVHGLGDLQRWRAWRRLKIARDRRCPAAGSLLARDRHVALLHHVRVREDRRGNERRVRSRRRQGNRPTSLWVLKGSEAIRYRLAVHRTR